jgi:hypothetical protein
VLGVGRFGIERTPLRAMPALLGIFADAIRPPGGGLIPPGRLLSPRFLSK